MFRVDADKPVRDDATVKMEYATVRDDRSTT